MLKYKRGLKNLCKINKNGLQTNTSKTDRYKTLWRSTHPATQQGLRKSILNLNGSESHLQVFDINFTC